MPFSKTSWYDSDKNIAIAHFSGTPDCLMDIELLANEAIEEWGSKSHKVYAIADVSDLGKVSYAMLNHYAKKMGRLFKERCEMSVVVTKSPQTRITIRVMRMFLGQSFHVAGTLDEALELVRSRQKAKGIFVPLD